jgi:hypothetical protein
MSALAAETSPGNVLARMAAAPIIAADPEKPVRGHAALVIVTMETLAALLVNQRNAQEMEIY